MEPCLHLSATTMHTKAGDATLDFVLKLAFHLAQGQGFARRCQEAEGRGPNRPGAPVLTLDSSPIKGTIMGDVSERL